MCGERGERENQVLARDMASKETNGACWKKKGYAPRRRAAFDPCE